MSPRSHRLPPVGPQPSALLAQHLVGAGVWDCRFGVADDLFTAEQAARQAGIQDSVVVRPLGNTAPCASITSLAAACKNRARRL